MLVFLLFLSIIHLVRSACPVGFELIRDGECRGSYANISLTPDIVMGTVIAKCNEIHGKPVIIHNDEHQSYWQARAYKIPSGIHQPMLLLGLVCNSATKQWQWTDGSPLDYKPKTHWAVLDSPCVDGSFTYIDTAGEWYGWTADAFIIDISCTTSPNPLITDDTCETFADDPENGVCYEVGDIAESWQDAQMICKKLGANLASIHNAQENSFLRRLAVSKGAVTGLYLGASISGKGGDFGWIDGSDWDYDNFAPGFPKPGFGECIGMDTASSAGQWINIACTQKLPVACIRQHGTRNITEGICSSDTWKEDEIVTSPGFPFSASLPCDFYLMVDEGKRVEAEIIVLEANSCCDNLIIYDGYFGSVLANLTGEVSNVTFTTSAEYIMKVSWQPQGGVGVLGVAITFRGV